MRIRPLAALIPLSLALAAAPAFAEQDLEKMNGAVTAEAGREYGTVSSMNGSVTIREGATVRQAETVNGAITIEGSQDDIRSALDTLRFTPETGFSGTASITITSMPWWPTRE